MTPLPSPSVAFSALMCPLPLLHVQLLQLEPTSPLTLAHVIPPCPPHKGHFWKSFFPTPLRPPQDVLSLSNVIMLLITEPFPFLAPWSQGFRQIS